MAEFKATTGRRVSLLRSNVKLTKKFAALNPFLSTFFYTPRYQTSSTEKKNMTTYFIACI
jgi:hypothetical protein